MEWKQQTALSTTCKTIINRKNLKISTWNHTFRADFGDWKFVAWNEPATLQMKAVSCEICSRCFNFFGFVFINFASIFRRIREHEQGEFGFKVKWKDLCNPKGMNLTRAEKRVNRFRSKTKKAHRTPTISRIDGIKYERWLRNFRLWFV